MQDSRGVAELPLLFKTFPLHGPTKWIRTSPVVLAVIGGRHGVLAQRIVGVCCVLREILSCPKLQDVRRAYPVFEKILFLVLFAMRGRLDVWNRVFPGYANVTVILFAFVKELCQQLGFDPAIME